MFRGLRSHLRELAFVFEVLPMLPRGIADRLTPTPRHEYLRFTTRGREVIADVFVPDGPGPHPGVVVCLGVVPIGMDDPRIPQLLKAWAHAGFVAVAHWSDAMRDRRLDPGDAEDLARAYDAMLRCDGVDVARSGLLGTCVGGSAAFLAAAHPLIRDRVHFVCAFAPYASLWTLARDIASSSRDARGGGREPWPVDQLSRTVFERTLRTLTCEENAATVLSATDASSAEAALRRLPPEAQEALDELSPITHLDEIHAPWIVFGHDRDDTVVPAAESRRLAAALAGRPGVRFTEYAMFQHADPLGRRLPPITFARELARFYGSLQPLFAATTRP